MADNLPTGYSDLLNWAAQNLVRQPDGSYTQAPVYSQPTTLNDIYAGIFGSGSAQPSSGLISHSVNTVPVDAWGNPVNLSPSPSTSGVTNTTGGQAGTAQMAATRPAVVDELYGLMGSAQPATGSAAMQPQQTYTLADLMGGSQATQSPISYINTPGQPNNTMLAGKDQAQLAPGTGLSWDPEGTGRLIQTPLPRPRPPTNAPLQITVNGGSAPPTMAYGSPPAMPPAVSAINAATVPMPRPRPNTPPSGAPMYQIRSGDTLGALAKRFGTTIAQLANANGIADPNRIRAGASLNLSYLLPPTPQQRPVALGGIGNAPLLNRGATAQNDLRESGMLDAFGMIR